MSDGVLLSYCLGLSTDYLLSLFHSMLQEPIVEHTSVMHVHVQLHVYDQRRTVIISDTRMLRVILIPLANVSKATHQWSAREVPRASPDTLVVS